MFSNFEKSVYKDLFERFSKEEYHVEYLRDSYSHDFEELRDALIHLDEAGILFLYENSPDKLFVELTPDYCYKFAEL